MQNTGCPVNYCRKTWTRSRLCVVLQRNEILEPTSTFKTLVIKKYANDARKSPLKIETQIVTHKNKILE